MMSPSPPDGLASLSAQRERARRSMPVPRHPVSARDAVDSVPTDGAATAVAGLPAPPAASITEPEAQRPGPSPADTGTTYKVTLYVDRATDEFMEAARVEGLTSRPKVDVSRSAVVRLALRRLMENMSPAEVKALLEGQAVRAGPGRKRR